jgi:hypothetical protein
MLFNPNEPKREELGTGWGIQGVNFAWGGVEFQVTSLTTLLQNLILAGVKLDDQRLYHYDHKRYKQHQHNTADGKPILPVKQSVTGSDFG